MSETFQLREAEVERLLLYTLKKYWGYDSFLEYQKEACLSILSRRDCFLSVATGKGKSLAFQLPILAIHEAQKLESKKSQAANSGMASSSSLSPILFPTSKTCCLVISPLLSLMDDQVSELLIKGANACALGSISTPSIEAKARNGEYLLIYTTPEKILSSLSTLTSLKDKISYIAVDESHCIVEWGKDFRQTYSCLSYLKDILGQHVPIISCTATVTRQMREEILDSLKMKDPLVLQGSIDRPNLFLHARQRHSINSLASVILEVSQDLNHRLRELPDSSSSSPSSEHLYSPINYPPTIIYAKTKRKCEYLAQSLSKSPSLPNLKIAYYHADLPPEVKSKLLCSFLNNDINVMVATSAFGLGINKRDIRLIVHYGLPQSLEAYFQQVGRGGRDGLPCYCLLLWNRTSDVNSCHALIESTLSSENSFLTENLAQELKLFDFLRNKGVPEMEETKRTKKNRRFYLNLLGSMISYATQTTCRRKFLLDYFETDQSSEEEEEEKEEDEESNGGVPTFLGHSHPEITTSPLGMSCAESERVKSTLDRLIASIEESQREEEQLSSNGHIYVEETGREDEDEKALDKDTHKDTHKDTIQGEPLDFVDLTKEVTSPHERGEYTLTLSSTDTESESESETVSESGAEEISVKKNTSSCMFCCDLCEQQKLEPPRLKSLKLGYETYLMLLTFYQSSDKFGLYHNLDILLGHKTSSSLSNNNTLATYLDLLRSTTISLLEDDLAFPESELGPVRTFSQTHDWSSISTDPNPSQSIISKYYLTYGKGKKYPLHWWKELAYHLLDAEGLLKVKFVKTSATNYGYQTWSVTKKGFLFLLFGTQILENQSLLDVKKSAEYSLKFNEEVKRVRIEFLMQYPLINIVPIFNKKMHKLHLKISKKFIEINKISKLHNKKKLNNERIFNSNKKIYLNIFLYKQKDENFNFPLKIKGFEKTLINLRSKISFELLTSPMNIINGEEILLLLHFTDDFLVFLTQPHFLTEGSNTRVEEGSCLVQPQVEGDMSLSYCSLLDEVDSYLDSLSLSDPRTRIRRLYKDLLLLLKWFNRKQKILSCIYLSLVHFIAQNLPTEISQNISDMFFQCHEHTLKQYEKLHVLMGSLRPEDLDVERLEYEVPISRQDHSVSSASSSVTALTGPEQSLSEKISQIESAYQRFYFSKDYYQSKFSGPSISTHSTLVPSSPSPSVPISTSQEPGFNIQRVYADLYFSTPDEEEIHFEMCHQDSGDEVDSDSSLEEPELPQQAPHGSLISQDEKEIQGSIVSGVLSTSDDDDDWDLFNKKKRSKTNNLFSVKRSKLG